MIYVVIWIAVELIVPVNCERCMIPNTVGSLDYDENVIGADQTYILTGYTIQCEGIVTTWEFCYQLLGNVPGVTFYPGIWENTGGTTYSLIQSNTVVFTPNGTGPSFSCQNYTLPVTEQFTVPSGSVVGLYSNLNVQLLHTTDNSQITTYQVTGNQSSVVGGSTNDVNYTIAIRVHLEPSPTTIGPATTTDSFSPTTTTFDTLNPTTTSISTMITGNVAMTTSTVTIATSDVTMTTSDIAMNTGDVAMTTNDVAMTTSDVPMTTNDVSMTTSIAASITNDIAMTTSDIALVTTTTFVVTSTSADISSMTSTDMMEPSSTTITSSGDGSSLSIAPVIAGVVVGVVMCIFIVLVIIFLMWYQRRRGRKERSFEVHDNYKSSDEDKMFTSHHYSLIRQEVKTIKAVAPADYEAVSNANYSNVNCDVNDKKIEQYPYSEPIDAIVKDCPKLASNDYQTLSVLQKANIPYQYEVAITTVYQNSSDGSDSLPDDEQRYEDPGHVEKNIYAWFEKKKFRKINKNNVSTLQKLGSGEFGVVHLGTWADGSADPMQVAVKTLNSECSESDRVKFLREAAIMGQFQHNNVVQLHGVVTEEENMMIVLEYMSKGDLQELLFKMKAKILEDAYSEIKHDLLSHCRQISSGLNYLANKHFIHRDLAARNILVSSDDVCKIADFGMARDMEDDTYYITSGGKIPIKWTAPEAILYKKYSTKTDVWSFGCVMYEVWSLGHKPFERLNGREYLEKITTGYRLPPPPGCPRAIYELMIQCWHPEPRQRPLPCTISRTLQKSDRALLTSSTTVTDDNTSDQLSMTLGGPLAAGYQLHLDLQQSYMTLKLQAS
ncbi:uncharacterized protein [Dysidea avara]|uniref:uncharacterized protein isoform X2 n=1 Tax=Dysidea avara TaxID=196820 RepID=UPI00332E9E61